MVRVDVRHTNVYILKLIKKDINKRDILMSNEKRVTEHKKEHQQKVKFQPLSTIDIGRNYSP